MRKGRLDLGEHIKRVLPCRLQECLRLFSVAVTAFSEQELMWLVVLEAGRLKDMALISDEGLRLHDSLAGASCGSGPAGVLATCKATCAIMGPHHQGFP